MRTIKKITCLLLFQLMLVGWAAAQNIASGIVKDNNGPIVGASVTEKGNTANGTASDANGNFRLELKGSSGTIIVSALGFKSLELKAAAGMQVVLELDAEKGVEDEVVVVGFGRQKKITLTGSVSTVSGKEIRQNPSASLQNTLSGRLPGFFSQQPSGRPGADGANFFIRGVSSYNNNNQPLIIVDDIEFSYDQFARLDPNEVESVSILKDASTTAIYGIKGANGVLIVTTQRGKVGKPRISFRTEGSLMQPTRIPKYLDAYESARLYRQAQINDGIPAANLQFSDADLELYKSGEDPYGHPNINWRKELFRDFSRQVRGNFDVNGGTERVKYFISMGYLFQDGILKNFGEGQGVNSNYYHKRYNYRSNLDIRATKSLDIRLDLYGNIGEINTPRVGSPFGYNDVFYEYSSFMSLAPFAYPIYNPDGSFGYSQWQRSSGNYNVNNIVGRLSYYGYTRNNENNMNFVSQATQKLDFITKGLSAKGVLTYASNYTYGRNVTRDQFPSFLYNAATDTYEPRDANVFRVRRFFVDYFPNSTLRTLNMQAFLNYDRTFGGDHHVYGLALFNQNSRWAANSNVVYNFIPENFRGYTARLGYDYANKYLFQLNGAYNGSDRFSKDNRYGFFPAASAGWVISEENFFADNIRVINRLKIRTSYGFVGNDKIGGFSYYYDQTYSNGNGTGGFPYSFGTSHNGFTGISEGRLPNPAITWETERKFDLGLEFGLFNDQVSGTVDVFDNRREDIITNRGTVSAVFGQALPPVNMGIVENKGFEVELAYRGKIGKDFNFNLKGNYSYAKNKIIFQDEPTPLYPYQSFTGNSIGQILVYKWIGFYDADKIADTRVAKPAGVIRPGDLQYEDLNNDGVINDYDRAVTGYPNLPNTNIGFQTGFTYKNFSLNLLFQSAINFNVRGVAEAIQAFGANLTNVHLNSWTPELGDNAQYPILSHTPGISSPGGFPSTFWFIRGDYLRLKTAEIGFEIPKNVTDKLKLAAARVYVNGYNLLTFSKLDRLYEFDPEINSGTDRVNYPPQRMINFGLNVTF